MAGGPVTDDTPKRTCRFVDGPENGRTFTMQGFVATIGMGVDGACYHAQRGTDGFDIDYVWQND